MNYNHRLAFPIRSRKMSSPGEIHCAPRRSAQRISDEPPDFPYSPRSRMTCRALTYPITPIASVVTIRLTNIVLHRRKQGTGSAPGYPRERAGTTGGSEMSDHAQERGSIGGGQTAGRRCRGVIGTALEIGPFRSQVDVASGVSRARRGNVGLWWWCRSLVVGFPSLPTRRVF